MLYSLTNFFAEMLAGKGYGLRTSSVLACGQATIPGLAGPFSLKNVHWTFFRALEPPEGEGF